MVEHDEACYDEENEPVVEVVEFESFDDDVGVCDACCDSCYEDGDDYDCNE